jgi:hypothetical protein
MNSDSEETGQDDNTPNSKGDSEIEQSHAIEGSPPSVTESEVPPAKGKCHQPCKQNRDVLDYAKGGLEFLGFIVLCGYAAYTIRIYHANHVAAVAAQKTLCEIQKQTTLMRDETIGTQGAILEFEPSLSVPAIVTAVRAVPGRVAAKNVEVKLTAQRIYLPNKKPIGSPVECGISVPQVSGTQSPNLILLSGSIRACYLPNFSQVAMDEIMFTRQSVTISGSFSYDNGFGQVFRQEFCRTYLGYRFTGFINGDLNHPTSGEDASFHDCSDFDGALRRALDFKNKYKESYVPELSP